MAEITCDVVKDLIPLYADDVLSDDSKMLVKEHLQSCERCNEYYKALSENASYMQTKAEKDKTIIKKIKQKINCKRLAAACIAAVAVAALSLSFFYVVFVREHYLSYEKSGIYVEDDAVKTKNEYQCFYGFYDPNDESILYMYLTTTPYHEHQEKEAPTEMLHMSDTDDTVQNIYYIPEEYVDEFKKMSKEGSIDELTDEMLNELKNTAPLLWSADRRYSYTE